jgi:sporulation protein YabP
MDKIDNYNHTITLTERKNIIISGVRKIENFDDEEFFIESTMGFIIIKGNNLELLKLDTLSGNVSIKGKFNSIAYVEDKKMTKEEGMFSKLFK